MYGRSLKEICQAIGRDAPKSSEYYGVGSYCGDLGDNASEGYASSGSCGGYASCGSCGTVEDNKVVGVENYDGHV